MFSSKRIWIRAAHRAALTAGLMALASEAVQASPNASADKVAMVGCGRWKSLPKKAGAYPFPYRDHQIVGCKAEAAVLYSAEAVDAKMAALTAKLAQTQQAMAQLLADKEQSSVARHAEQMVRIDRTQDAVLQAVRELDQRILNHKALADLKAELRAELSAELSR